MSISSSDRRAAGVSENVSHGTTSRLARLAALLPVEDLTADGGAGPWENDVDGVEDKPCNEIARALFRSKRGQVLLTGPRGVGKTTILRRLAHRIRRGEFPFLDGYRVLRVDVSNVGPEDSRACLESIFSATGNAEGLILCLDGIASLMKRDHGGTNKPLLRALLKRGGLKVVGTMAGWEYAEHVAGDAQMLETFTRLDVAEPTGEGLTRVVSVAAETLAVECQVEIPAEVIERAIAATSMFLLSESHPAKGIDVLREACEEVNYGRTEEREARPRLEVADVVAAVSRRTGIPCETISGQGRECDFEAALSDAVAGQDAAVREVAAELELLSAGLTDSGKPASVLMFAGMTGVGKTELAKRVAELYSTSRRLQVYSMGNFTEAHSVSGIIGVPPGYVGHEEGGRLINELRADPYSVFLLDEAEKCHPNVWKPFLNLFDEGWIVDQRGVKAYADRAIFILTTNAGDKNISQLTRSGKSREEIGQNVRQALSRVRQERSSQPVFPPQFLSRMRRILVFGPLDEAAMIGIAERAARRLSRRWEVSRGKRVALAPDLIRRIGVRAHEMNEKANGQEGGRIVQKLLSDHVEHAIYRRSIADRDGYEVCQEIHVSSAAEEPDDGARAVVRFL